MSKKKKNRMNECMNGNNQAANIHKIVMVAVDQFRHFAEKLKLNSFLT